MSTRVWCRMLPPTIIAAPTSEMTLPKPAMSAASSGSRASRQSHQTVCQRDAPRPMQLEPQPRVELPERRDGEAQDDGGRDDHLGDHHRRRRVDQAEVTERAAAPEHERDEQADHDRRQRHAGVDDAEHEPAAAEPRQGQPGPEGQPDQQADGAVAIPETASESSVISTRSLLRPRPLEHAARAGTTEPRGRPRSDQVRRLRRRSRPCPASATKSVLAVLVDAEVADDLLPGGRRDVVGERLRARGIDLRPLVPGSR